MTFITATAADDATGDVEAMYRHLQGSREYLPNYARVFCHRPAVMDAWSDLQKTIRRTIDHRRYELVTLAAAQTMHSSYCCLAHGQTLCRQYYDEKQLTAIFCDGDDSPLDKPDKAMMGYARKVAGDASAITRGDVEVLKQQGFDDAEIFDITAAAAARCFFARIADALGAQPDAEFMTMEPGLRETLTVGRKIENPNNGLV